MTWFMLAEYTASLVEILITLFVVNVYFERRYPLKKHIPLFAAFSLFMLVFVQICNSIALFSFVTTFFWMALMAGISVVLYKANYIKALAVACIVLVLFCAWDFAVLTTLEIISPQKGIMVYLLSEYSVHRCIYILSSKAVGIIACIIFAMGGKRTFVPDVKTSFVLYLGSIVDMVALTYLSTATVSDDIGVVKIAVSIANIFIFLFFVCWIVAIAYSSKYKDKKLENAVISTQLDVLERDNVQLEITYGALAKVTHDFKNHLRVMQTLVSDENYTDLKKYISELDREVKSMQSVTYTGDSFVDAVINTKVHLAREKGITLQVYAEYPRSAELMHTDICAVLVNLLDNAIAASEKAGKGDVFLTINAVNQMLMINVTNPSLAPDDGKANDRSHGYGKKIVASIAEKYSGHFDTLYDEGVYTASVMLSYNSGTK